VRVLGRDFEDRRNTLNGDLARLDVLEFIEKFWETNGYAPSFRDIMTGCGFNSTSSVAHHLSILRDLGKVEYLDNIARSVRTVR
jgi:SOS-response transcriptional repressor LexA